MPLAALWTFIGSLVLLALGLTYKWVENAHGLKLSEKEADRLRTTLASIEETRKNEALSFKAEIDALKEAHNKEISDIKELHQRESEELKKEIYELSHVHVTSDAKELSEPQNNILKFLFNHDNQQVENLAQALQVEIQLAK